MPVPQKLTPQEVQQQLFDALMEQIEPKLMTGARKETAAELAAMNPETRAEWMRYFHSAYEEFLKRWPEFAANASKEVGKMGKAMVQISGDADASALKNIEKLFDDNVSPSSAA
ncbi:hypothetical protein A3G69_00815 [Candidatus Peribacteria bacterium RIFCSPLOWO2_12_FULL_53_10]|nr:MAG: hypothetical protein A3G69_00815 [Candidatus Peribacteria bacterium RIFCSPLOWO2_12_FULL_53_10]